MQIPTEVAKDESKIRADLANVEALATEIATYDKSLVAFIVANKAKVIAVAVIVFLPTFFTAFELGKHLRL